MRTVPFEKWSFIAKSMYGSRYQTALSILLGVSDRTVRTWVSEKSDISFDLFKKLRSECLLRMASSLEVLMFDEFQHDDPRFLALRHAENSVFDAYCKTQK